MGSIKDTQIASLLSGIWPTRNSRPSRNAIWISAALAVVLQGLLLTKWFFHDEDLVQSPSYNVEETVGLITAYYELLRDMRYLGSHSITYPPHTGNKAINRTLAIDILGLDEQVYETLTRLPYITPYEDMWDENKGRYLNDAELADKHGFDISWWAGWMGQQRTIFWRDGHFADYRQDSALWLSRDPTGRYSFDRNASIEAALMGLEAIPKTAIPISALHIRRFGLVLVLDTASNRIVVLDTHSPASGDPFFNRFEALKWPLHYKIPKTKFYGREMHARLAPDLLRDFIHLTSQLEPGYVPGSVRSDEMLSPELSPPKWEKWVRDLYKEFGWPATEPLEECQYLSLRRQNHSCDHDPMQTFRSSAFTNAMVSLRHNISTKYLKDWYCPVPRRQDFIDKLNEKGLLTAEQNAYAAGNEPVIPLNLDGWGAVLVLEHTGFG